MQVKKIAALCTLAFAGFAGQAQAALSSADALVLDEANANGRVIFIAGASAVQKGFIGIVANLFVPGSARWYGNGTNATSADHYAVAGTLNAPGAAWDGQNVIIIQRVAGGSVFGVNPVARNEAINALLVTSTDCGAAGTGADAAHAYTCTVGTNNLVPDAGISDVAPQFFKYPYNTEGETPAPELDAGELATLTATPIYGLAFGPAVTAGVPASVKLNKPTVAAILAGGINTWDKVDSSLSGDVVICRRTPGSGTQAVFNAYFGNFACGSNYNVPADRDTNASGVWDSTARTYTVTPGTGHVVVVENASSGDLRKCLDAAADGTSYTTKDRDGNPVTVSFTAAGNKALGVLSMDSLNASTATSKWTFRNLDGAGQITWDGSVAAGHEPVVSGTGKNATVSADGLSGSYIDGTWDLQAWESFNIPARTVDAKLTALQQFIAVAQDPSVHAAVPALRYVTAGIPGTASNVAGAPQVLQAAYLNGDQCAPYNKQ